MRIRFWFAALLLLCALRPATVDAQDRDEFQLWSAMLTGVATQPEPPGLMFWADLHARRGAAGTVVLVRPAVGVEVTPWLSLWAGYAWIPTFDDATGGTRHEHRVWQQATLKHRVQELGLALSSRTRFEQRFSEAGDDVALRLRQFVRANWRPSSEVPVGVAFWDELFVGLTQPDWGAPQGVDQNRVFLGPFLQATAWARLEVGYLFAYLDRGATDLYAHVLAVNLFLSPRPDAVTPVDEDSRD
ncbi:MAG: DUF2490 domain-containing protein [Sandaracinaceae bacterium]